MDASVARYRGAGTGPRQPRDQSPLWRPRAGRRTVLTNSRKGDRDDSEEKVHTEGQPFAAAG